MNKKNKKEHKLDQEVEEEAVVEEVAVEIIKEVVMIPEKELNTLKKEKKVKNKKKKD